MSSGFPTASQLTEYFWNQLHKYALPQDIKTHLLQNIDIPKIVELAEKWRVPVPRDVLGELQASIDANGKLLVGINRFWWGMLLHAVFRAQLKTVMGKCIPELLLLST